MKKKILSLCIMLSLIVSCAFLMTACGGSNTQEEGNKAYLTMAELPAGVINFNSTNSSADDNGEYKIKGETVVMALYMDEGYEINTLKAIINGQEYAFSDEGTVTFVVPDNDFAISFTGSSKLHNSSLTLISTVLDAENTELSSSGKTVSEVKNEYTVSVLKKYISSEIASNYVPTETATSYKFSIGNFSKMISENIIVINEDYGNTFEILVETQTAINIPDLFDFQTYGNMLSSQVGVSATYNAYANGIHSRKFCYTFGWSSITLTCDETRALMDYKSVMISEENVKSLFDISFSINEASSESLSFAQVANMQAVPVKLVLTLKSSVNNYDSVKDLLKTKTLVIKVNGVDVEFASSDEGYSYSANLAPFYEYSRNVFGYNLLQISVKEENSSIFDYLRLNNLANIISYTNSSYIFISAENSYYATLNTNEGSGIIGYSNDEETCYVGFVYGEVKYNISRSGNNLDPLTEGDISYVVINDTQISAGETNTDLGVSLKWEDGNYYLIFSKSISINSLSVF